MKPEELSRKPYDRARLDMIAGAAKGVVLDLTPHGEEIGAYLTALGVEITRTTRGDLGGAVGWYTFARTARADLGAEITRLAEALRPGAPLLLTFYEGEGETAIDQSSVTLVRRKELDTILSGISSLKDVRIEGRRPYPFEDQIGRVFCFARRV